MTARPRVAAPIDAAKPLAGRHALVTGAGSGIGAAIAAELARLGARLTLIGRRPGPLAQQCATIFEAFGGECRHDTADVTDAASIAAAFAAAADWGGPIDLLVNNAGAAESAPFLKTDLAMLERMLAVNLRGAFICTQAALPAMLAGRMGRIVNIASTAGLTGYAYVAAYCAAKHALIGLTRALARELAARGITVNAVCPGYTETPLVDRAAATIAAKTGKSAEAARAALAASNPMRRLMTPDEVAAAVGWLCTPAAAAVTGQSIVIAGGEIMP
ncbi:MAG TPA: SDR family NAD(P)-dependent oxidoreductase [Stellaceae bacterium]|nr:SDR family NAD(P)-dependent oxidoreductase [Stellaceae bacterium]